MTDQRIKHQEEMVGAGHPTKPDTLNRLMLVEHDPTGKHKGGFFLMQKTETHIQWKHLYDEEWQDLIALADLVGAQGDPGNEVSLQKTETHIQWKLGDGEWTNLIALADLVGAQGDPGTPAENISLQKTETHIQWKLGDGEWTNLIALADLVGAQGDPGTPAENISLQKTETHVQWKLGDGEWANLIALSELTGAQGDPGTPAENISLQKTETHIQWKLGDGEWQNLIALADLKGDPGGLELGETSATAYRGDRGKTAYDHSQAAHAPSNAQKNSDITKGEIEAKLTGEIDSHSHAEVGQLPDYTAGDFLLIASPDEKTSSSTSWFIRKEFRVCRGGTLRIKFDLKSSGYYSPVAYGIIYRNGSPVGTQQSRAGAYVTFSEDISGWSVGDLCQLYTRSSSIYATAHCQNFKLYSGTILNELENDVGI